MRSLLFSLTLAVGMSAASSASAATIEDFLGAYVGTSEAIIDGAGPQQRDLDMEIIRVPPHGFLVRMIVVTTVDGSRDAPGVKRRYRELKFRRDGDEWEIDMRRSLFSRRPQMDLEEGDEVLRARIDGRSLRISSQFIQSSGEYIHQVFDFHLNETGLDTHFIREVDGVVSFESVGRLIRTN